MECWKSLVVEMQAQFEERLVISETVHSVDCRVPQAALCKYLGDLRQQILTAHPVRVPQLVFEMNALVQTSRYVCDAIHEPSCWDARITAYDCA